jgi:hypothetical protein
MLSIYSHERVFEKRDKLTLNSSPIPHPSGHKNRVVHAHSLSNIILVIDTASPTLSLYDGEEGMLSHFLTPLNNLFE